MTNHGAFLKNERQSFEWLFEKFLKAILGEPPKLMITDQDGAIARAICSKLPATFHRYCIWHILNNFNDKSFVEGIFKDLHECIWDIECKEEFEARWKALVEEQGLVGKSWIEFIYELRVDWVPIFCKCDFSSGVSSSQRVESSNSFLKQYVHKKHSLIVSIIRFNPAIRRQPEK